MLRGVESVPDEILSYLFDVFYPESEEEIAAYQPQFIIDHVLAACTYEGRPLQLTLDKVKDALRNLSVADSSIAVIE